MFEFQIIRYEGIDNPDELLVELHSFESPEQSQTIHHQVYIYKDESQTEGEFLEPAISVPLPGLLSISVFKQGKEFGVLANTDLLSELKHAQYLPLFLPAREIDSLEGEPESFRVLIAMKSNNQDSSNFFTQFSFYLYKQYTDLKKTAFIEALESSKKQRTLEFDLLRALNEASIQKALKDDKLAELETKDLKNLIVNTNMLALVDDLENQNSVLEGEIENKDKILERMKKFSRDLVGKIDKNCKSHQESCFDSQAQIENLVKTIENLKVDLLDKETHLKKVEFDNKMLEQTLVFEKLKSAGKGSKENFYLIFKDFLSKETSGSVEGFIEELELHIKTSQQKFSEYQSVIRQLQSKLETSENSYQNLEKSLSERIFNKSEKKREFKQNLNQVQEKLFKKKDKIKNLKLELSNQSLKMNEELYSKQQEIDLIKLRFSEEKNEFFNEIQKLKKDFDKEKTAILNKNQNDLRDFEITLKSNQEENEKQKKILIGEYEKKISQASKRTEFEIKKINDEKQDLMKENEKNLTQLRTFFEQEKKKLLDDKIETSKENEKIIMTLKSKFESDKKKMVADQNDLIINHDKVIAQLKSEFESEKRKWLNEKNDLLSNHQINVSKLKHEFDEKLSEIDNEKSDILSENQKKLALLIEKFEKDKRQYEKITKDQTETHEKNISALNLKLESERIKHYKDLEELKQTYINDFSKKSETLKIEAEKTLNTLKTEYESEIFILKENYGNEVYKLKHEIKSLNENFDKTLKQTKTDHNLLVENLKLSYEEKIKCQEESFKSIENRIKTEKDELEFRLNMKINEIKSDLETLNKDLETTRQNLLNETLINESLTKEVNEKKKVIESLELNIESELKAKKNQADEYQSYIEEIKYTYEQTIITSKITNEDNFNNFEHEIRNLRSELAACEKEKNLNKEKLQQSQENFLLKIKVLQDENAFLNVQIQQNFEKHQEDLNFCQKKYENFKAVTEKQQELALQESELIRDQLSQEIKHLSRQIQSINDLRLRENENSSQIIKDIKENMEIVLKNTTEHYESKIEELNKEIQTLHISIESISQQCDKKIKESNRSFKDFSITKIISSAELIENIYPASSPMRSTFQ